MGILLRQNDDRSQYQEKLAEELRERAKKQASGTEPNDQTKDSRYLKDTEQTSARGWIVAAVICIVIFVVIILLLNSNS